MGEAAPPAPTPFGKYLLDREIARGGMARVWLARLRGQGGFEKRLVVKQILPHLADDPRFVSLFVEEAKTLVALSHPHIVPVYELGVVEGTWFLAMEHVEGATLASILATGPLAPEAVVHLAIQICDALSYAHERFQLVHRDVTPRNVMVERTGHARLLDFGIAARATPAGEAGTGAVYGTPGYVSPEQARGEAIDGRTDIFSLGCVIFEGVGGRPAFLPSELEKVRKLAKGDVPHLSDVHGELAVIVGRCLEPDPAERPKSANELGRQLRAWLRAHEEVDPTRTIEARVETARAEAAQKSSPISGGANVTPGASREKDRSLAVSRLLDDIVGTPPMAPPIDAPPVETAPETSEGTMRLDRPRAVVAAETSPEVSREAPAAPAESPPPEKRRKKRKARGGGTSSAGDVEAVRAGAEAEVAPGASGNRRAAGIVLALATAALAAVLVSLAGYDPPVADPERSETDVDGTMWIEPSDGDLPIDAGVAETPDAGATVLDAGESTEDDGGRRSVSDAGARVRGGATLRVTSDGHARLRLDGRDIGTAPIHEREITSAAHELHADCPELGTSGDASFRAAAGARVQARITCSSDPVGVVIRGGE